MALVMAIGMLFVLTVAGTTVVLTTSANTRNATRAKSNDASYSLAEAGLAQALSRLAAADDPTDSTILPATTITLPPGSATYSGTLNGSTWTLTSTGKITNPTGPSTGDVQRTLTRTVTLSDTSVGTFSSPHWSRLHHDSIFSCFDIPVNIPVDVTANVGLCLEPGGSITGQDTKVSAGLYVEQDGPPATSGPRAPSAATGWTSSTNVFASDNARASSVVAAGAQSPNLDVTGYGFSIPAGSRIDGITAVIERSASASGSLDDFDVYLLKNGAPTGSDKAVSSTYYPTTDGNRTYGSSSDLWGTTWTVNDVNASNFGLRLKVDSDVGSSVTAYVDYVSITISYTAPPNGIGASGSEITSFNSPACRVNGGAWNAPCGPPEFVWADTVTENLAIAFKPRINWSYWYSEATLGPTKNCNESSGTPPVFDSNSSYDGSNAVQELTPETYDYVCRRKDGNGNIQSELSWNRATRVLTVKGPIFFDGGVDFQGSSSPVHYQGRGTIWASEQVRINEAICAGGSGTTNCRSAITSWDSSTNNLLLVAGGQMSYWTDSIIVNTDAAAYQGILYGRYDCELTNNVQLSAPVLCHRVHINTGATNPVINPFSLPSTAATGQAYVDGTTSDIQLIVGAQSG